MVNEFALASAFIYGSPDISVSVSGTDEFERGDAVNPSEKRAGSR